MERAGARVVGVAACLLGWSAMSAQLRAQTLSGTVVDSESRAPVSLAYVGLLAEGRELVAASLAGGDGAFTLRAPTSGAYFLYVARAGYQPVVDGVFELGEDGTLAVQVGLKPSPVALAPVVVEGAPAESALDQVGFYDRAAIGLGSFLVREEIERLAVDRLTDVLRTIPRLEVASTRPIIGLEAELNPEVTVRLGTEYCSPTLYVDGAVVAFGSRERDSGRAIRPDDFVDPSEVEAVEVYTRISEIPLRFDAMGGCGVLLIWTRMR